MDMRKFACILVLIFTFNSFLLFGQNASDANRNNFYVNSCLAVSNLGSNFDGEKIGQEWSIPSLWFGQLFYLPKVFAGGGIDGNVGFSFWCFSLEAGAKVMYYPGSIILKDSSFKRSYANENDNNAPVLLSEGNIKTYLNVPFGKQFQISPFIEFSVAQETLANVMIDQVKISGYSLTFDATKHDKSFVTMELQTGLEIEYQINNSYSFTLSGQYVFLDLSQTLLGRIYGSIYSSTGSDSLSRTNAVGLAFGLKRTL
jgi:hypothetical protein